MALKSIADFNKMVKWSVRKLNRMRPTLVKGKPLSPLDRRQIALATWAGDPTCVNHFIPELQARIQVIDRVIDEEFREHAVLIEAIGERKALRKLEALFKTLTKPRETS